MNRFITSVLVGLGLFAATLAVVPAQTAQALEVKCESSNVDQCKLVKTNKDLSKSVWNFVSLTLVILAGVAFIVIIIGGFMYVTSAGDSAKVTAAKNTILYAVIGVAVALLSAGIISVVNNFFV